MTTGPIRFAGRDYASSQELESDLLAQDDDRRRLLEEFKASACPGDIYPYPIEPDEPEGYP